MAFLSPSRLATFTLILCSYELSFVMSFQSTFQSSSHAAKGTVNLLSSLSIPDDLLDVGYFDPKAPPCTVYLYTRGAQGSKDNVIMGAKHWALYFDWGYYSATFEANKHEDILTPSTYSGKPRSTGNVKVDTKIVKTNLRVTPYVVEDMARANKYNGKRYSVIDANCQIWATELARNLGFRLPTGQAKSAAINLIRFALLAPVLKMTLQKGQEMCLAA